MLNPIFPYIWVCWLLIWFLISSMYWRMQPQIDSSIGSDSVLRLLDIFLLWLPLLFLCLPSTFPSCLSLKNTKNNVCSIISPWWPYHYYMSSNIFLLFIRSYLIISTKMGIRVCILVPSGTLSWILNWLLPLLLLRSTINYYITIIDLWWLTRILLFLLFIIRSISSLQRLHIIVCLCLILFCSV